MDYRRIFVLGLGASVFAALGASAGCSAASRDHVFQSGGGGAGGAGGAAVPGLPGAGGGDIGLGGIIAGGGSDDRTDADGDGFTVADGDCNDHDKNVNPGAIEVVATPDANGHVPAPADEDCDGKIDNVPGPCDDGLDLEDFDPMHGAQAIDLCSVASPSNRKWGVLDAKYVRGSGAPAAPSPAVGIFDAFGPNVHVQGGKRMLGISSGRARLPGQPHACGHETCSSYGPGSAPPGFPQDNPSCPPSDNINDDIGLEVTIRTPTNATGYEFRFKFYTFEYPDWVCESFNDQFIALATPSPPGSYKGNLSFDTKGNPVSVNIGFFDVCEGCPHGTAELAGTGFGTWHRAGATSWLKTQAPVHGGEPLKLRFMIWDTGDQAWDSTALVDGFKWIASGGVNVATAPVDVPQ